MNKNMNYMKLLKREILKRKFGKSPEDTIGACPFSVLLSRPAIVLNVFQWSSNFRIQVMSIPNIHVCVLWRKFICWSMYSGWTNKIFIESRRTIQATNRKPPPHSWEEVLSPWISTSPVARFLSVENLLAFQYEQVGREKLENEIKIFKGTLFTKTKKFKEPYTI